jgi:hypothetical protein
MGIKSSEGIFDPQLNVCHEFSHMVKPTRVTETQQRSDVYNAGKTNEAAKIKFRQYIQEGVNFATFGKSHEGSYKNNEWYKRIQKAKLEKDPNYFSWSNDDEDMEGMYDDEEQEEEGDDTVDHAMIVFLFLLHEHNHTHTNSFNTTTTTNHPTRSARYPARRGTRAASSPGRIPSSRAGGSLRCVWWRGRGPGTGGRPWCSGRGALRRGWSR